jgi:deoxyribonuclease-4
MPKHELPPLGAHMSISGGLYKAFLRGEKSTCQVIQIFTRNRNRWNSKALSKKEIDAFLEIRDKSSVRLVAAHDSYLINLASPRSDVAEKSFHTLLDELGRAELLRIPYLVIHPGAHLGEGESKGLLRISEGINRIHDRTEGYGVKILLETTAGQGTNLGYRFEHLADIIERTESRDRLGVCFDTCHAFAAGYDFCTETSYSEVFGKFDEIIGLNRLMLFHINDSKKELGSRVDRHEHPGAGKIGLKAFSLLLNDGRFRQHPFLLETPKGKDPDGVDFDVINLDLLKRLKEDLHKK